MTTTATATAALRPPAAHHEAGHVAAGCLRATSLRWVRRGAVPGEGLMTHTGPSWNTPFVAWAGPWAEARYSWGDRPADAEDEDGLSFADRLAGVFHFHPADLQAVLAYGDELAQMLPTDAAVDLERAGEREWTAEMERVWPAVEKVAARLLTGAKITEMATRAAVHARWVRSLRKDQADANTIAPTTLPSWRRC